MTFSRNDAFSMSLTDPDNPQVEQKITSAITIGGELYIFSKSAVFRMLSADTLDPEVKHPESLHTYEKKYSIGSEKLIVARTILQFHDIFKFLPLSGMDQEKALSRLWRCCQRLLDCESASFFIYDNTMKLMPECDRLIELHKKTNSMPPLPKIPDIETYVSGFLFNGKLLLTEAFGFMHDFFGMPYNERNNAHFDKHVTWLRERFGENNSLSKMVSQDLQWIQILSECSNAVRHPEKGQRIEISNIGIRAGNKFSAPSWQYDLTKKALGRLPEHVDLVSDLNTYCNNLSSFLEQLLLVSIDEIFKKTGRYAIYQHADHELNRDCPIKFYIGLSEAFRKEIST